MQRTTVSSYYPPRAKWYTRLLFVPGERARRRLHLDKFRLRGGISPASFLLSLAVPGFAFYALDRRMLGRLFVTAYCLSALVFVAALGYRAGSIGYGLMISVHATSIIFLEGLWLASEPFRTRLFVAVGTLFAVWALVYAPAVRFVENHWLMPLRVGNRVLIVHRKAPASIHRGDKVAYRISEDRASGARGDRVFATAGFGLQPVLAMPGDHVRFTPQKVFVNDQPMAAAPHMPGQGEIVVPEKMWFIWPAMDIMMRGGVAENDVSATLEKLAMVPQKEIVGKAFKSWFGRRQ